MTLLTRRMPLSRARSSRARSSSNLIRPAVIVFACRRKLTSSLRKTAQPGSSLLPLEDPLIAVEVEVLLADAEPPGVAERKENASNASPSRQSRLILLRVPNRSRDFPYSFFSFSFFCMMGRKSTSLHVFLLFSPPFLLNSNSIQLPISDALVQIPRPDRCSYRHPAKTGTTRTRDQQAGKRRSTFQKRTRPLLHADPEAQAFLRPWKTTTIKLF